IPCERTAWSERKVFAMASPAASSPLEMMRRPEVTRLIVLPWNSELTLRYSCAWSDAMFVLIAKDMILSLNFYGPGIPFPRVLRVSFWVQTAYRWRRRSLERIFLRIQFVGQA